MSRTGPVTGWHLARDGTLYVRLGVQSTDGPDGGDQEILGTHAWFKSPPDVRSTTIVEEMLLDIVIASMDVTNQMKALTLYANNEPRETGESLEKAHTILAAEGR